MRREDLIDLNAFAMVSEERNFTRAAAKLGVSQSALSHTVRRLETRLGVRLLTRTTRQVALTGAGEQLLATLRPALDAIDVELASLSALRDKPAGSIRITAGAHAAETVLWPMLERLLPDYPDIKVELSLDQGLTDIVAERFDAGVRLGEQVGFDVAALGVGGRVEINYDRALLEGVLQGEIELLAGEGGLGRKVRRLFAVLQSGKGGDGQGQGDGG